MSFNVLDYIGANTYRVSKSDPFVLREHAAPLSSCGISSLSSKSFSSFQAHAYRYSMRNHDKSISQANQISHPRDLAYLHWNRFHHRSHWWSRARPVMSQITDPSIRLTKKLIETPPTSSPSCRSGCSERQLSKLWAKWCFENPECYEPTSLSMQNLGSW